MRNRLVGRSLALFGASALFAFRTGLAQSGGSDAALPVKAVIDAVELGIQGPFGSVSPDGGWLAYSASDADIEPAAEGKSTQYSRTGVMRESVGSRLFLLRVATGETTALSDRGDSAWGPVWSPDGKRLAFFSDHSGKAQLWIYEPASAKSRVIGDAIIRTFFPFEIARWMPDSRRVLCKVLPEGETVESAERRLEAPPPVVEGAGPLAPGSTVHVFRFAPPETVPKKDVPAKASTSTSTSTSTKPVMSAWMDRYLGDLALIDVGDGSVRRVVKGVRATGIWLSPDGSSVAFTDHAGSIPNTQRSVDNLVVASTATRSRHVAAANVPFVFGTAVSFSPDGKWLAYLTGAIAGRPGQELAGGGDCMVVPVAGGPARNLTPGKHPYFGSDYLPPLWDAQSTSLTFVADQRVWRASRTTGRTVAITKALDREPAWIIEAAGERTFWSPDGGRSFYIQTRDADSKKVGFSRVDAVSGNVTRLFEEEKAYGSLFSPPIVSKDGRRVFYVAQDVTRGEDVWTAGIDFASSRELTHVNPGLETYRYGKSRLVEWRSAHGELLHGAVLLPSDYVEGRRYPMIVHVYGGVGISRQIFHFGVQSWKTDNFQLLATRGYAVFLPDAPLRVGTPMEDLADTVLTGVNKLIELGIADPDRLGVWGHSYGGYSTIALLVQTPRFKAGVMGAGLADLIAGYGEMSPDGGSASVGWSEAGQGRMEGTPWQFRDRYIENSPIFYLDRVKTPLLILHGSRDGAVPFERAEQVFVGLRRLGKPVLYAKYMGEEHAIQSRANVEDYWNRILGWFDDYVKNPKAPADTDKDKDKAPASGAAAGAR